MWIGTQAFIWRRKLTGFWRRTITRWKNPMMVMNGQGARPRGGSKIIWSTQVVADRRDELQIVRENIERLRPVLAWSSLTVDGHSGELARFIAEGHGEGFDNLLWFSQPRVVSRDGHSGGQRHYNRISINYLRGWLSNLEPGEECLAEIFCHNDGDWGITIRPESILPLAMFFHRYPQVAAITRNIDDFLKDEPGMWPDKDSGGKLWFGRGMLSTNLIISPIERFRPLVERTYEAFHRTRGVFLEETMRELVSESGMVVAYPTTEYFRDEFFIDIDEIRKPFEPPT